MQTTTTTTTINTNLFAGILWIDADAGGDETRDFIAYCRSRGYDARLTMSGPVQETRDLVAALWADYCDQ